MCDHTCCGLCDWETFRVSWKEQELAFYTWHKNAALRKDAALFGLTTSEPDLPQPPVLRDAATTITCTILEPDPTYDHGGLQDGPPSAAIPEDVTPQSLNEHSLHRQSDTLTSATIKSRMKFDLSSLSLKEVDVIGIAPDPSPLALAIPKQSLDRPSSLPRGRDIIDRLIAASNRLRAESSNASNGSSPPTNSVPHNNSQSNQSTGPQRSRKRTSDQGNRSKQGSAKRARTSSEKVPQAKEEDKRFFACPFWKKDSIRHRNCFRGVKRIRDVKQHLRRNHQQPVFCRRCGMEFGDQEAALGEHLRAAELCEIRYFQDPDGITTLHQNALKRYSERGGDKAAQWYVIWDYLFPGGPNGKPPPPRPASPYVDQDLSEEMSSFREFAHREGWRALAYDPDLSHVAFSIDEEMLQRCLDRIHENWLARRSTASQTSWEESPVTLSASSTPDESAPSIDLTSFDHQIPDDNIMTLSDFAADPDFDHNFFGPQIDGLDDFMEMPSMDTNSAQAFPSVLLLTSEHSSEHAKQVATLDPTLISR